MEPTRIELDLPVAVVNYFQNIELPNNKKFEEFIASMFQPGEILTIHVVVESNGVMREFCTWTHPEHAFYNCHRLKDSDGVCPAVAAHQKVDMEAQQPKLPESD